MIEIFARFDEIEKDNGKEHVITTVAMEDIKKKMSAFITVSMRTLYYTTLRPCKRRTTIRTSAIDQQRLKSVRRA